MLQQAVCHHFQGYNIDWSPEYISVNKNVEDHMEYMNKDNKLKLCYTPLHKMKGSYKCSFLNT